MGQYAGLAGVYDYLVQGVDFEGWIDYVEQILKKFNTSAVSVADLACGTGNTSIPFARRGYLTTGIDIAPEMITLAREKAHAQGIDIQFAEQDMRVLHLPRKFDLITCFHDGLNYLLSQEDLRKVFQGVHKNLVPGGMFIFDLNAVKWLSGSKRETNCIDEPELTIVWESFYDHSQSIWQIDVIGFMKQGSHYKKFKESHQEKAYSPAEIIPLLEQSGFKFLDVYDAFTFNPPDDNSLRHFYIASS
ncbi:MAG: methyltransferase domain-containing protein [Firmicutes bacterium]|nr:methyltransferase domain-containing protein [Bacillota bacterium]